MPRGGDALAVADTSVAVPTVLQAHRHHLVCATAVREHRAAIAGHALFETYSVLTRLPGDVRLRSSTVTRILDHNFPRRIWLAARELQALFTLFADTGLEGGAVYDALVGASARSAGLPLLTRDERASATYRRLGIETLFITDSSSPG